MKKFLFLSLTLVVLFGCAKESDIDNLQNQIDDLKSNQIASISSQVTSINTSITNLVAMDSELKGYITTLQEQKTSLEKADEALSSSIAALREELENDISVAVADALAQMSAYKQAVDDQIESLNAAIEALQTKDKELQQQITTLKNYVETDLKTYIDNGDNTMKTWVSATFATLEQYNATSGIIATIQGQLLTINNKLTELESTAAGISLQELQEALSTLDEDHQAKLNKAVSDCNDAITTAKEQITAAYTTAIQNAISSSESSMKTWVNNQLAGYYTIAQTDAKIDALKNTLEEELNTQRNYLEDLISNLEASLNIKIDGNKALIDGLQGQLNNLSAEMSEIAGNVIENSSNISKNASDIAQNAKQIAENASDINTYEQLITANKQLIKANEAAITANASAISDLQNRATADEKTIADNAANIAKNAQDIAANAALISANAGAIYNNAIAISDNSADILQLQSDLATTRTEITAAYQQAIASAINTLDGKLTGQIATEVATLNTRIDDEVAAINVAMDALSARVTTCEKDIKNIKNTIYSIQQDIENLQDQVAAILARIQSIAFVPAYSDGKVPVSYTDNGTLTPGTATLDFELQPASTATELAKVWQTALKMKAVYTITKATPETAQLTITSVSADKGYLSVTVSGAALSEDFFRSRCSANASLVISDGNNELASEYVPLVPWTTDVISFGDPLFKAYCVENFDSDGDGEITEDEAKAVTTISASMLNISSLIGIEYFSNLESIDVSFNKLETLDLSHSPKLETVLVNGNKLQSLGLSGLAAMTELDCSNNKLTALNVSESEGLLSLNCTNNQLGSLNVQKNKALTDLQCSSNQLVTLDVKNNTALETLYCRKNSINVLDVTKLTGLKNLDCSQNSLSSLNLYQNLNLDILYCASNHLYGLGLSANTKLTFLDCRSNTINSLDISKNALLETINCTNNQLVRLDVSSNPALETIACTGNPALTKLWVKDAAQAAALSVTKDDFTTIAYNNGGINIPDAKLKTYLVALFDEDEDGEISILEAENVQNVNCSSRAVADLTGLENCPNLKYLNFNGCNVSTIELPNLKKLETIVAYGNPIQRINVNNDTALTALYLQDANTNALSGNSFTINAYDQASTLYLAFAGTGYTTLNLTNSTVLTSYDVTENIQLTRLVASGNSLVTGVDVSPLTALIHLDLRRCALNSLDVDTNIDLVYLAFTDNQIPSINLDNNIQLDTLGAANNQLSTIRLTNNTSLEQIYLQGNNLQNVNVRKNTELKILDVSGNSEITALALGYNPLLENLKAGNTDLTDIDLSANLAVKTLNLSGCSAMHIIDLTLNTALVDLDLSGTSIATIDLSNNTALKVFKFSNTPLKSSLQIGDYFANLGVVFYLSGDVIKIVSTDEVTKTWGPSNVNKGASSATDGTANTNKMLDLEAAQWCRAKGPLWYLPAIEELKAFYNIKTTLNPTLSSISGVLLENGNYWSSTEYDISSARSINWKGETIISPKGASYRVRAILALN